MNKKNFYWMYSKHAIEIHYKPYSKSIRTVSEEKLKPHCNNF